MKKRTICLLLAMIMVLSIVLAGCSKTAETPAADEPPPRLSRRKPPTTPKPLKLPKRLPSPRLSRRPFSS